MLERKGGVESVKAHGGRRRGGNKQEQVQSEACVHEPEIRTGGHAAHSNIGDVIAEIATLSKIFSSARGELL
jgi:hypothetical protein